MQKESPYEVVVDLETLSLEDNCVIASIGAVKIDTVTLKPVSTFYRRVRLTGQDKSHIDPGTVSWWNEQDAAPRREVFINEPRSPIAAALYDFALWLSNVRAVWGNGSRQDIVWLESAYRNYSAVPVPWAGHFARKVRAEGADFSLEIVHEDKGTARRGVYFSVYIRPGANLSGLIDFLDAEVVKTSGYRRTFVRWLRVKAWHIAGSGADAFRAADVPPDIVTAAAKRELELFKVMAYLSEKLKEHGVRVYQIDARKYNVHCEGEPDAEKVKGALANVLAAWDPTHGVSQVTLNAVVDFMLTKLAEGCLNEK